jgi:predicted small secreted protein
MKNRKMRLVFTIILGIAVLFLSLSGCEGGGGEGEDLSLDAEAISNTLEAVKTDIADMEEANHVIHVETDTILEGPEPLSDDLSGQVETAHMSSHGVLLVLPYMKSALTEIDSYKTNPEENRGKILVAIGRLEVLGKLAAAAPGSTKWSKLMEWPVTGETPHDLVHSFYEDDAITSIPDYKEAAGKLHDAMHGMEDSTSSLELNLELLRDMIKTAGKSE